MASISGARRAGASVLAAALASCGLPQGVTPSAAPEANAPRPFPPRPLSQVFVLEAAGASPEDTVVSVTPGARRVVVLRRSAPDYALFARLEFSDSALKAPAGASTATLTLRPRPGLYALELVVSGTITDGASIVFSYGAHFVAPAQGRQRYGSDIAFERELAIGRLAEDSQVVFLSTSRPGTDMLRAPLPGPGHYLVAAPR